MMNATQARQRVFDLAKSDPDTATEMARTISDPWFRSQALAAVARYAADDEVCSIAREALAAATKCRDAYQRAAVAAWPIRALIERGFQQPALEFLRESRNGAKSASPPGSQAEALLLLLQAAFSLGASVREDLVRDLVAVQQRTPYWRVNRAAIHALGLLSRSEPSLALRIAESVQDQRCRAKALAVVEAPESCEPRQFFW